jgi:tetratricopeptide (TPR) repeat protein
MKIKHILLASAVLVSVSSFAQKDELKKLKKIYEKDAPTVSDVTEYKANLEKLAPVANEETDKVYYNFFKGMLPVVQATSYGPTITQAQIASNYSLKTVTDLTAALNATLEYEKRTGKKVYTDDINKKIGSIKAGIVSVAIGYGDQKKYKEAAEVLYSVYQLDKKDQDKLFYAASYAFNAADYDKALQYYTELKEANYSGEGTSYLASNKASGKEETFNSKDERDLFIKAGTHEKPRNEKIASKRGEIYKYIAFILVDKNRTDEAKAAIVEAKKANPEDDSLILTEADIYLKLKDYDTYNKLISEVLAKDPKNVVLLFNLGVTSANANKLDEAEKYYVKALEIDPTYFDALINFSELRLRADAKIVDEMNKLGTTEKDNKRYEVLKASREKNFKSLLPYLEKADELKPNDEGVKKTLLSVYNALEMTDKYKALKAKM